jgi:hypothetical protein
MWRQTAAMKETNGPAENSAYNSFCVGHVLLGGKDHKCKIVQTHGFNTPNDPAARATITKSYPGSMLQAPLCRAIAARLTRTHNAGLPSSMLLSQAVMNNTVHNHFESKSRNTCLLGQAHAAHNLPQALAAVGSSECRVALLLQLTPVLAAYLCKAPCSMLPQCESDICAD